MTNTASSFPETHQGKVEKYSTIAEFINYIPELVQGDFQRLKLDKPISEWHARERNYWKIALFLGEVREIAPAQTLSGDQESGVSKRALYNFMPKSRHNQCWVFMDLQSASDMFRGVKQQNDIFMMKRSTDSILGDEFKWFYQTIENRRKRIIEAKGFTIQTAPRDIIEDINSYLPNVDEIPDNKAYVIYPNNEYRLITIEMQRWHHKTESDNLQSDTGLSWSMSSNKQDEIDSEKKHKVKGLTKITSKKLTHEDYLYIADLKKNGKMDKDIIEIMRKKDRESGLDIDRFKAADPIKNLNNKYNDWKKRQLQ